MKLNKYDSQGFLYTHEEALERALAIFRPQYLCYGYKPSKDFGADGLPIPQATVKPYNIGRNAKKRDAKAAWAKLRSNYK